MNSRLPPFVTQRPAIQWSFYIVAFILVVCALWPWTFDPDRSPVGVVPLTYVYTVILIVSFVAAIGGRGIVVTSELFLFAPLLLAVIGLLSLGYSWLSPGSTTYSAALIPLLLCAMPLVVPLEDLYINFEGVSRFVLFLLSLATVWHLIGQFCETAGLSVVPGHEETLPFCFVILFAGFGRRGGILTFVLIATGLSLAMRPSSSLLVGAMGSCALIWMQRTGRYRTMRFATISVIVMAFIGNLLVLHSASVANLVYSVEPFLKQDVLAGHSNNEFRLGVIEALRNETMSNSILFGKFFVGDVMPYVTAQIPWWYNASGSDYAPVHSDFLLMLSQGGLVGYAIFAIFMFGFARCCVKGAVLSRETGRARLAAFFDAALAAEAIFCFYVSFNPMMQKVYIVGEFFILVPICVFLYRDLARTVYHPALALGVPSSADAEPLLST